MQLSRDELVRAWRTMRTIRAFEDAVHEEFSAGNIPGFVHLYAGEEASARGRLPAPGTTTTGSPRTHRGHGHCIAKGCDVKGMMKEIFGRKDGLCGGKGGSMHIADLSKGMLGANGIVGGGPPLICGAALTAKTLKTGGVAIAFVGDGGSNQGTTAESMNLAKAWNLPAIFVFEDNGYAEVDAPAPGRSRAIWSSAARPSACRRGGSTATTSSTSRTPRARRSSAPAPATVRASSTSSSPATTAISRAMP